VILFSRWFYLFSNSNTKNKVKNLYVFDEKNDTQNHNSISFSTKNIKFLFNKNAVKNIKQFMPPMNDNMNLNKFKNFNEFLRYTYNDLKNNENICSGFYLSKTEVYIINNLKNEH
tara:strand:+ start:12235 stop:12579 length:345 start_codon:yes stop_codon:yes gene_type:complete